MKNTKQSVLIAGIVGLASALASAAPITFVHEGSGSGTLDGVAFSALFTITASGDTNNRIGFGSGWYIGHTASTINIDGVGSFDFVTSTRTFVNNGAQLVGFSRGDADGGSDLFNGPVNDAFGGWDMTTSIGPISGGGDLLQWGSTPAVVTTGGVLFFDDFFTDARFTATVVPAPATLLGLVGLAATRRRRSNA